MKRILVSACLLGTPCRYDGRSKPVLSEKELSVRGIEAIPICPEVEGGLPTPRVPAERVSERVLTRDGRDVTSFYERGAKIALQKARAHSCVAALLKERSPSCGSREIYDGSFAGRLIPDTGITAEALLANGIPVFGESELDALFFHIDKLEKSM